MELRDLPRWRLDGVVVCSRKGRGQESVCRKISADTCQVDSFLSLPEVAWKLEAAVLLEKSFWTELLVEGAEWQ